MLRRAVEHLRAVHGERVTFTFAIVTNGMLLDDEVAAFLDANDFVVNLSCDGVAAAQALRGPHSFPVLDAALDRLRTAWPALFARLRAAMTLTPGTVHFLADSVAYFQSKQVPTVLLQPVVGARDWDPARIKELDAAFDAVAGVMKEGYERTGAVPLALFRRQAPEVPIWPSRWICGAPSGRAVTIDVDGQAYACVMAAGSFRDSTDSARGKGARALWLGPAATCAHDMAAGLRTRAREARIFEHADRRRSIYRGCAGCEYLDRCYVCPLAAGDTAAGGDPRCVSAFLCAFNQVALAHRDAFPWQP